MNKLLAPDGRKFPWGTITEIHKIGTYSIVQYVSPRHSEVMYHPYIDGHDTCRGFTTLDEALVYAVAARSLNINTAGYLTEFYFNIITQQKEDRS